MKLFDFLNNKSGRRTPILIMVMTLLSAWFMVSGLSSLLLQRGMVLIPAILGIAVQVIALIGFWNLRRWSLIVFLVLAAFGYSQLFVYNGGEIPTNVVVAYAVVRGFVIIPGLIYWRSMSW